MRFSSCVWVLLSLLTFRLQAGAEQPIDQVKSSAGRIIAILGDPNLKGLEKKAERRRLIRQEVDRRFDWPRIARGCLGRHWTKRSREEQKEFIEVFSRFLERSYLDKIEPYYEELDRIDYQRQEIIDNFASVKTVITTKQQISHPVEYRLEKSAQGEWRIYDAVIEGVSLVKNYRVQFDEIITRSSYSALMKDLKRRLETNKP